MIIHILTIILFLVLLFQKSFISIACLLVLADVATSSQYYYQPAAYNPAGQNWGYQYKYPTPVASSPVVESARLVQPYTAPASYVSKPSTSYTSSNNGLLTSFAGFDFNSIAQYINDPYYALEKSQGLLEDLNNGLPDALAKMDPSIKNDIKQVNQIVLEICDKAVANSNAASTTSYYTPEGMRATCEFLNKHIPTVSRGLDDPAIITDLIQKLGEFGRLSKEMGDLLE